MNEMKSVQDLGEHLDPPGALPSHRTRDRVFAAIANDHSPVRSVRRRWWPRLALAGGLAAAVTLGVLAVQVVQFGDGQPAAPANAAAILHGAALHAKAQPGVPVRGSQFVYVESIATVYSGSEVEGAPLGRTTVKRRWAWHSVDGTGDGLIRERPVTGTAGQFEIALPGCRDGFETASKNGVTVQTPCKPLPHYRPDAPTNVDEMLRYLRERGAGTKNPPDQQVFDTAGSLITETYLPPAALTAVFQALATLDSVTVVGEVTDEAGRTGIAVGIDEVQGSRTELIFDRDGYAYLGQRSVLTQDQDGLRAGQVLNSMAMLSVVIVDRAGQTP